MQVDPRAHIYDDGSPHTEGFAATSDLLSFYEPPVRRYRSAHNRSNNNNNLDHPLAIPSPSPFLQNDLESADGFSPRVTAAVAVRGRGGGRPQGHGRSSGSARLPRFRHRRPFANWQPNARGFAAPPLLPVVRRGPSVRQTGEFCSPTGDGATSVWAVSLAPFGLYEPIQHVGSTFFVNVHGVRGPPVASTGPHALVIAPVSNPDRMTAWSGVLTGMGMTVHAVGDLKMARAYAKSVARASRDGDTWIACCLVWPIQSLPDPPEAIAAFRDEVLAGVPTVVFLEKSGTRPMDAFLAEALNRPPAADPLDEAANLAATLRAARASSSEHLYRILMPAVVEAGRHVIILETGGELNAPQEARMCVVCVFCGFVGRGVCPCLFY